MAARGPSHIKIPSISQSNGSIILANGSPNVSRKAPTPIPLGKLAEKQAMDSSLDPEALFTRYTVTEVKNIQNRLRADADAKQEELRQMVGERYRDLLQASTSIIDISDSSKRVISTLGDTIDTIQSQKAPVSSRRQSMKDGGDHHLHALQLLAAHIKLLLDSPEHLWRLIENKKFLSASWLFQLSSVVHQALLRSTEEEESWSDYGIEVEEHFPLIERQWDVVKQFRQQIVHKATLALRDFDSLAENTCSTLLTLHLLDRKPLSEAFSTALQERTKGLQLRLNWKQSGPSQTNGHATGPPKGTGSVFRRVPVRAIKDATVSALAGISSTIKTLRTVFQEVPSQHSLILRVLESIQADGSSADLPDELRISTESLLMTLPSSTQLMMLPPNLIAYKPHVDLSSSSSTLPQLQFTTQLETWFQKSCHGLQSSMESWFSDLESLREVWNVRSTVRKWFKNSTGLEPAEIEHLETLFEAACRKRVVRIWKSMLVDSEEEFEEYLTTSLQVIQDDPDVAQADSSPVDFLFSTPPFPVASHSTSVISDSSFHRYQATLHRQLSGRSNMLDKVLNSLETCARSLQQDLNFVLSGSETDDTSLAVRFSKAYKPEAESLCDNVIGILNRLSDQESDLKRLLFISRVANDLSSHSSFVLDLGCGDDTALDFRKRTLAVHSRIIDRWRNETVTDIVSSHHTSPSTATDSEPSPALLESLLRLSQEVERLGLSRDASQLAPLVEATLGHFVSELLHTHDTVPFRDLRLLRKLIITVAGSNAPTLELLDDRLESPETGDTDPSIHECLSRTQLLLAGLLPHSGTTNEHVSDKFASLLPHGLPNVEQQYQPAFDMAKSSRFGLLLVDNSIVR